MPSGQDEHMGILVLSAKCTAQSARAGGARVALWAGLVTKEGCSQ